MNKNKSKEIIIFLWTCFCFLVIAGFYNAVPFFGMKKSCVLIFSNSSNLIFDKLPTKARLLFIVETPLQSARFYKAEGSLYVTPDVNSETYKDRRYVVELLHASPTKPALSLYHKKMLKENLEKNNIFFCNNFYQRRQELNGLHGSVLVHKGQEPLLAV